MLDDAKLKALIVRNIGDIEAAFHLAVGELSDQLKTEIVKAVRAATPEAWIIEEEDDAGIVSFYTPYWLSSANECAEFWLSIDEVADVNNEMGAAWNEDIGHSWIATAVETGPVPSKLALWFNFDHSTMKTTEAKFGKLMQREKILINRLSEYGFELNESGRYLIMPIKIDQEALACAFEDEYEDFDTALQQVGVVVNAAKEAMDDLNKLADIVRNEAKNK